LPLYLRPGRTRKEKKHLLQDVFLLPQTAHSCGALNRRLPIIFKAGERLCPETLRSSQPLKTVLSGIEPYVLKDDVTEAGDAQELHQLLK